MEDTTKTNRTIDEFAAAMKGKMLVKAAQRYAGWDNIHGSEHSIIERLIEHAKRGTGQWVDVANFAMMLWNAERTMPKERE